MALPKAVEEQAKAADEMLQKLQQPENAGKPEEAPVEQKPEEKKPEEAVAPVEQQEEPKAPEVDSKEYERLKSAHAVLQGKYNAEVPRLWDRVRELEAQLAAASTIQKPAPSSVEEMPQNLDGVIKKLSDEYGEDFAGTVRSLIREEIATALTGVKNEVAEVRSNFSKTKEEKFLAQLTDLVPTWRDIFNDPKFSDFLDGVDSFSGRQLRDMAVEANKAFDAKRLSLFYKAFLEKNAPPKEEPKAPETKDKREALITPATSGKQNASPSGEKPEYVKASDLEKFYRDVTRGIYTYKPKEREAIEAKMNRAISNGWIVSG